MNNKGAKIAGLILSAGASSRMKVPKALLNIGGKTLLEDQVLRLREGGAGKIYVVVGSKADEIKNSLSHLDVEWVLNRNWRDGNFSSIQCGIEKYSFPPPCGEGQSPPGTPSACPPCLRQGTGRRAKPWRTGEGGIILLPVDVAFVNIAIIKMIISEGSKTGRNIIPTFNGRGGHPVFLTTAFALRLISDKGVTRLDHALKSEEKTIRLEVGSDTILNNINTEADFRTLLEKI